MMKTPSIAVTRRFRRWGLPLACAAVLMGAPGLASAADRVVLCEEFTFQW